MKIRMLNAFGRNGGFTRYAACQDHVADGLAELDVRGDNEVVVARAVSNDERYVCSCGDQAKWFLSVAVIER